MSTMTTTAARVTANQHVWYNHRWQFVTSVTDGFGIAALHTSTGRIVIRSDAIINVLV